MKLDLVNDLFNNLKENKTVQNFIKELSNYLGNNVKNNSNIENEEIPIIENILSKNNLTTGNKNAIRWSLNDVILKYAQKKLCSDAIYFVKNNENDMYTILKAKDGKIEETKINKNDMPNQVKINDVLKLKDNIFVVDSIYTKELQEDIKNMAKEILSKQNKNLERNRREGHLYVVTEEIGDNRFLWDLTDAPKTEFEEVDIPKDLLSKATEGMVLKYINGKYEYYSDDGFERIEKMK